MSYQWRLPSDEPTPLQQTLSRELGLHPLVAGILERRGVGSPEAAQRFLRPSLEHLYDPYRLQGMDAAVETLHRALESGARIVVSGDYDVDGITSSALLGHFLRAAGGAQVRWFIPSRFEHGYGLTPRTVEALLEMRPDVVVTVDNGTTAVEEVARLRAAGVATVVTDHHLPRETGGPDGVVVNPRQPGCGYPFPGISGCGVAFKLVTALRRRLRDAGWWSASRPEPNLKAYLDLVAIGTVGDVVPLQEENRVLVAHGLEVLNRTPRRPGLEALLAYGRPEPVTARTIAFQIAPRLNAAGRMSDASLAVELLLCEELPRALDLAARLEQENLSRRARGEEMLRQATDLVEADAGRNDPGIVVASPAFHEGIIGITAAKLAERYGRPAVVLAGNGDSYKGSARARPGFHITEALTACSDLLLEYGGHAGAAGCKLSRENLEPFRERLLEALGRQAAGAGPPTVWLEGRLDPGRATAELVEQVGWLAPYGNENAEPVFLVEPHHLAGPPRPFGRGHLKWHLPGGVEMVAWRAAETLPPEARARFCVRLGFNDFRGVRRVQLTVNDYRLGE